MINFKQITFSDKKVIDAAFAGNEYRACDFCFTNLYAWNAKFKTVYAIEPVSYTHLDVYKRQPFTSSIN